MAVTLKDVREATQDWILRLRTYSPEVTWFGANSSARAWARATGGLVADVYELYVSLLRRVSITNSSGDFLSDLAAERGARRLDGAKAQMLIVVVPATANVSAISLGTGAVAGGDELTLDDLTDFGVGDEVKITNGDGTDTETQTIVGVSGSDIEVGTLTNSYTPGSDDVDVLRRVTIPADTSVDTAAGIAFQTKEAVTTGERNPVLNGLGAAAALSDVVWCEAVEAGSDGNVEAKSVTDFSSTVDGIVDVYNPAAAFGGTSEESDGSLKYRAVNSDTDASQETLAWIERVAREGNSDVLRAIRTDTLILAGMELRVLKRQGGSLSTAELTALEQYLSDRVRSNLSVKCENVSLTSVEVEATIELEPDFTLEDVWRAAAARLAEYLDLRTWAWGEDVDESQLLALVRATPGIANLDTSSFLPAADVDVDDDSLPVLLRLSLEDADTGDTIGAELAVGF